MDIFWYLLARQRGGGGGATLLAPTIAQSGSNLTLSNPSGNGGFAEYFNLYNGDEIITTLPISTTTFDLNTLDVGDYTITATCAGTGMTESPKSSAAITLSVYAVTLALTDITASPAPTKILSNVAITIALSTSGTYVLPDSVSVVGATAVYTRTNDTSGTLVLSDPTGAITVSAAALEKLAAPTISVTDDTLTIETTDFATQNYEIYADDTLVDTIPR